MVDGPSTAALVAPAAGVLLASLVGYGYALHLKRKMRRWREHRERETQPAE